jgi:hypothetical protein
MTSSTDPDGYPADPKRQYAREVTWQGVPPWCGDPASAEAFKTEHPLMGCWSLYHGIVTGEDYCQGCEACIRRWGRKPVKRDLNNSAI